MTDALCTALTEAAPRLSQRALTEMYADPFWQERFGDRGREHTLRDGDFHVRYLVEALAAGDPQVFVNYARWLREVLVTRGMCSRHLAAHYERLARAIDEESWPDRRRAVEILEAGIRSLAYADGHAGAVDAARPAIVAAVGGNSDDLDHHLSYLADALALERPELFARYATFIAGFLQRHRGTRLCDDLAALAHAVADASPTGAAYVTDAAKGLP